MSKRMMLALPEVKRLVSRIPVAESKIKSCPIQLRFCQFAGESKMTLKEQCDYLGVPWHCRKLPAEAATKNVLRVAKLMRPSVFAQSVPTDVEEIKQWGDKAKDLFERGLDEKSVVWGLKHREKLGQELNNVASYLTSKPITESRVSPKVIVERSRRFSKANTVTIRLDASGLVMNRALMDFGSRSGVFERPRIHGSVYDPRHSRVSERYYAPELLAPYGTLRNPFSSDPEQTRAVQGGRGCHVPLRCLLFRECCQRSVSCGFRFKM